jgi:hypothetical protein
VEIRLRHENEKYGRKVRKIVWKGEKSERPQRKTENPELEDRI